MSEPGEVSPPALTGRRLFLAVFLVAALLAAPRHDHNENRTLDLLRALEHGRLSIDEDASNTSDRAWVPDAGTASVDTSVASAPRGHFYSGGSPGLAFALLPVHEVARFLPESLHDLVLVLAGAALPLALGALGVRRALLALAVSGERASGAALVHALATLALPFGTRLYASSLVVALVSWSLSLVLARRGSPPKEGGRSGGGTRESLGVSLLAGVLA
ncbi:hypothetical protein HY251_19255, partial [bacterium]|nr:hypothetical protein [bacterium]